MVNWHVPNNAKWSLVQAQPLSDLRLPSEIGGVKRSIISQSKTEPVLTHFWSILQCFSYIGMGRLRSYNGFDSRMLQTVSIFPSHPLTVPKTAMMQGGLPWLSHQEGNTASPLEKNMSEEEEEYVPETWEILAGVVCAETYEEFDRAYSLLKRGKKAPKKSSVDLWKVLSGEYKELNEGRRKKWEEKKKLEKLQQQEKKE